MSTPHNSAELGDIAKTVLMPGDPLRAEYIAKTYLEDIVQFNKVRNMYGYTGNYKGTRVSVMGSGMGMPSIGIYSHELYSAYGVDNIIRIGSAGALADDMELMDVVLAIGACTDSNYASQYNLPGTFAPTADFGLLKEAHDTAMDMNIKTRVGNILSSDIFYNHDNTVNDRWKSMNVLVVDMEAAALYMNAASLGKRALCMLTVSDHLYKNQSLTAAQRQESFDEMMKLALETVKRIEQHEVD